MPDILVVEDGCAARYLQAADLERGANCISNCANARQGVVGAMESRIYGRLLDWRPSMRANCVLHDTCLLVCVVEGNPDSHGILLFRPEVARDVRGIGVVAHATDTRRLPQHVVLTDSSTLLPAHQTGGQPADVRVERNSSHQRGGLPSVDDFAEGIGLRYAFAPMPLVGVHACGELPCEKLREVLAQGDHEVRL
eukprot:CAMPEP_0117576834 /NCGR_PEP_ID=MMETSP0784-20121206/63047_1 /TAXON_ID=39447 /ORGANISM="" /LENGTH=194 /DNA_ID=CAMNT_0005376189 /DNA_START=220 /DNA_END=804 /DNA_ORIENTATION=+